MTTLCNCVSCHIQTRSIYKIKIDPAQQGKAARFIESTVAVKTVASAEISTGYEGMHCPKDIGYQNE